MDAGETIDMVEFAARLRAARAYMGFTLDDMAELLGTTRQAMSRWEKAKVTPPPRRRIQVARTVAAASGLPFGFFLEPDLGTVFSIGSTVMIEDRFAELREDVRETLIAAMPLLSGDEQLEVFEAMRLAEEASDAELADLRRKQREASKQTSRRAR